MRGAQTLSSDAGDTRAGDIEDYLIYGDLSADAEQSDSSNASSAPLDHSAEDYNDWNQEGCPDGYQFDAGSDPDSESNWMS